ILCAGAVNSPKLLLLSGIGDREELERHGIRVNVELPSVGCFFKDQPFLRMTYRSKVPTYNLTGGLRQKLAIAAKFVFHGEGPISNLFEAVGFLKSRPSEVMPDIRLTFLALGFVESSEGHSKLAPFPALMVSLMKSYPVSCGRIRLVSNDPAERPRIEYPLFANQADVDTMIRGIHTIREIMTAEPIAGLIEEEIAPGQGVQSEAALERFVRKHATVALHSIGTCRMGVTDDAVVSPELRVHGLENLWVADASIMPDHISADTNATSMMIGAKLGRQLCRGSSR
ncbi:MAG TPA: GMC oxidoreductase, partial [Nitrospira sp.]|nr:GMC oxidoreductase [Nitrospira sp.]